VKQKNNLSCLCSVKSGIRQGGILSSLPFNIYADLLISALRLPDLGCHIGDCYVGCIAYADDLILLSGSLTQFRRCFSCVTEVLEAWTWFSIAKKSGLFKAGVGFNEDDSNLHLNGGDVGWVDKLKYLGIYILKDRFLKVDTSWVIRKFYAAANAINCHTKSVQELSRL